MGQYFYFFNATTGADNTLPIDPNEPNVIWVSKLNYMQRIEILDFFRGVCNTNNWSLDDDIIACGDGGDTIKYKELLLLSENPYRDDNINMCDTDDEE